MTSMQIEIWSQITEFFNIQMSLTRYVNGNHSLILFNGLQWLLWLFNSEDIAQVQRRGHFFCFISLFRTFSSQLSTNPSVFVLLFFVFTIDYNIIVHCFDCNLFGSEMTAIESNFEFVLIVYYRRRTVLARSVCMITKNDTFLQIFFQSKSKCT